MNERLERVFIDFADDHEDSLMQMEMTKEEFVENAKEWSETKEGNLEIQKFILEQEVMDLEKEVNELQKRISKKNKSIEDINSDLKNL